MIQKQDLYPLPGIFSCCKFVIHRNYVDHHSKRSPAQALHLQGQNAPGQPQDALEVEDSANQIDDVVYLSGLKLWLALSSVLMVALSKGLDLTIVAVTVPSLTDDFKTVYDIGWYSAASYLPYISLPESMSNFGSGLSLSAFTFFFGKVYTVFPLKQVFVTSVVIFTLGSLLRTVAPTSAAFITGRAIAGFGSSGIGNGAVAILSRLFPLQKRPLWLGIVGGVQSVALVSAPLIGRALIDSFSWRTCFGINLPVGGLAVILIICSFRDPTPHSTDEQLKLQEKLERLDLTGTLIIVPCITCLLLALQWGGTRYGWNNAIVISLLVIFGTLLAIFGFLQYRFGDEATLPPIILKTRTLMAGAWFQACCDGTLAVTEYYIATYFQGVRGFTAAKSGA